MHAPQNALTDVRVTNKPDLTRSFRAFSVSRLALFVLESIVAAYTDKREYQAGFWVKQMTQHRRNTQFYPATSATVKNTTNGSQR